MTRCPRDARQQVGRREEGVDLVAAERDRSPLGADEAVLHDMGDSHADVQADNPRGPLQRMGGAHGQFELIRRGIVFLQCEQRAGQHVGLGRRFLAEQVEHRDVGPAGAHARLRFSV